MGITPYKASPTVRLIEAIHNILWRHGLGEKGGFASVRGLTYTMDSDLCTIDAVSIGKSFISRDDPSRGIGYALVVVTTCNTSIHFSLKNVFQSTESEMLNVLELLIPVVATT